MINDNVNDVKENIKDAAKDVAEDPKEAMEEAGKEWADYIQAHPLQSILFGIIGYFAIKGAFFTCASK